MKYKPVLTSDVNGIKWVCLHCLVCRKFDHHHTIGKRGQELVKSMILSNMINSAYGSTGNFKLSQGDQKRNLFMEV
jgi:hypothetical protein